MKRVNFDVRQHVLYSKHEKLSEKEKRELLKKYNITLKQLPKIRINDPAIKHLNVKPGDIIKITRNSPVAGKSIYYRVVIRE